jgi:PleD family two-component response regulator
MAIFGDGGFAISLPTVQIQDAGMVADRMRKAVERLCVPNGDLPKFTVSVGVAQIIKGNDSAGSLIVPSGAQAAQEGPTAPSIHDSLNLRPVTTSSRKRRA